MAKIDYYTIHCWMRDELHLDDTELHCYAVIHSLSKGDNWFNAGVKNIMEVLGKSEPTVINALKSLTKKGLIVKVPVQVNKIKRYYYKSAKTIDTDTLNNLSDPTLNNLSDPTLNNLSPYILKENNKEVKEKRLSNDNPKNKRFVKPTIEQIQAYIDEKKLHFEAERFFDYYESKGWMIGKNHMKDWKAACRTWENMRKSETKKEEKEESAEPEMSEAEAKAWNTCQEWMEKNVPGLKDSITYNDFCEMRALAHFKPDIFAAILMEIEESGIGVSIIDDFDAMCQGSYYDRIWDNG